MVGEALDQSERSPGSASNGSHMKSEANNLQGNGLEKGPGASQVPDPMKKQKTRVSHSLEHFLGDESKFLFFS